MENIKVAELVEDIPMAREIIGIAQKASKRGEAYIIYQGDVVWPAITPRLSLYNTKI